VPGPVGPGILSTPIMTSMHTWEYAELFWDSARKGVAWYGSNGAKYRYSEHGLDILQAVGRDGWEVVGYASSPESSGEWAGVISKCLLRRRLP
jgi:hypothetical protein